MPPRDEANDDASEWIGRRELGGHLCLGLLDEGLCQVVERPNVRLDRGVLPWWRAERGEESVELGDDLGGGGAGGGELADLGSDGSFGGEAGLSVGWVLRDCWEDCVLDVL